MSTHYLLKKLNSAKLRCIYNAKVYTQHLSPLQGLGETHREPTQIQGELRSPHRKANVHFNITRSEMCNSVTLDGVQVAGDFDLFVASIKTTDY